MGPSRVTSRSRIRTYASWLPMTTCAVLVAGCVGVPPGESAAPPATRATVQPPITASPSAEPASAMRAAPRGVPSGAQAATVTRVVDGDTIWVTARGRGGALQPGVEHKIRLLEYDSPEATTATECGGPQASAALDALIPVGSSVWLLADREDTDPYGRFLRYVWDEDGTFVNLAMVRSGHGEAVLYEPNDRYIADMRAAEREARDAGAGMWGAGCAGRR